MSGSSRRLHESGSQYGQRGEEDSVHRPQQTQAYGMSNVAGVSNPQPSLSHSRTRDDTQGGFVNNGWNNPSTASGSTSRQPSSYPHSQAWNPSNPTSNASVTSQHPGRAHASQFQSQTQNIAESSRGIRPSSSTAVTSRPAPVPSEDQVNDYLVAHMGQKDGLYTGWSIQGYQFSVYALFSVVVQMGGSSVISQKDQWAYLAQALKFPVKSVLPQHRNRAYQRIGVELREFFLRMLGGLEILWERTKAADDAENTRSNNNQSSGSNSEAYRRHELSLASSTSSMTNGRPTWNAHGGQSVSDSRASQAPPQSSQRLSGQHLGVRDLTNSTPPTSSKQTQTTHSLQQLSTNNSYPPQHSISQSYQNSSLQTLSPVESRRQPPPPPNLAGYHNPPQNQLSGRTAPQLPMSNHDTTSKSQSAQNASTHARGVDYIPPLVSSYEDLVDRQSLALPPHGSGLNVPHFATVYLEYAWRAHELRSSIRKMSSGETHRSILPEEIIWWNRHVLLLQKNPKVVIPKPTGSQSFPTDTQAPPYSSQALHRPTTINPTSIQNLVQHPSSASRNHVPASYERSAQDGRSSQPDVPISAQQSNGVLPQPTTQLQSGHTEGADGLSGANTATVPVKKKPGRPAKERDPNDPKTKRQRKKKQPADGTNVDPHLQSTAIVPNTSSSGPDSRLDIPFSEIRTSQSLSQAAPLSTEATISHQLEVSSTISNSKKTVEHPRKSNQQAGPSSQPSGVQSNADFALPANLSSILQQDRPSLVTNQTGGLAETAVIQYHLNDQMPSISQLSQPVLSGSQDTPIRLGANGKPVTEAMSAARSMALKARWERARRQGLPMPGRKKIPVVVNSASPIRVLHLSGNKVSQAQISERDATTPTKVITRMRKVKKPSRLSQGGTSAGPDTLADALASIEAEEEDDDEFDPFMELSQTFMASPSPLKEIRDDPFVAYQPARPPAPKFVEDKPMPEEVDVSALAAAIDAGMTDADIGDPGMGMAPDIDAEGEEELDPPVEILELLPKASRRRAKGKGEAVMPKGKDRVLVELPASQTERRRSGVDFEVIEQEQFKTGNGAKRKKVAQVSINSGSAPIKRPEPFIELPPAPNRTSKSTPVLQASTSVKGKGKADAPAPVLKTPSRATSSQKRKEPSPPAPRATRSRIHTPPLLARLKKNMPRRTGVGKSASHLTRSISDPPSASLRVRPKPAWSTQSAPKQEPKQSRKKRSPSVEGVPTPPRIAARPSRPKSGREGRSEAGPRFVPGLVDRAVVSIPIKAGRRRRLILLGYYSAFIDDDSDEEQQARGGNRPSRAMKPLPGRGTARSIRAREPDTIPDRFASRPGPALLEPWKSALDSETMPLRTVERECGWKGCNAILGSESILQRHVRHRDHTSMASFKTGPDNRQTLWRCHWYACEGPCFESRDHLDQHITARHISGVLYCPFQRCDLTSLNVSHLSRHAMKQHEEDELRPICDLTVKLPPLHNVPHTPIPETVRADELTTHRVPGSIYGTQHRRDWLKLRIRNNCFGGENPTMHVEHPVPMLQADQDEEEESDESSDEENRYYNAADMAERNLRDKANGRRRKWELLVLMPRCRRVPAPSTEQADAAAQIQTATDVSLSGGGDRSHPIDIDADDDEAEVLDMTAGDTISEGPLDMPEEPAQSSINSHAEDSEIVNDVADGTDEDNVEEVMEEMLKEAEGDDIVDDDADAVVPENSDNVIIDPIDGVVATESDIEGNGLADAAIGAAEGILSADSEPEAVVVSESEETPAGVVAGNTTSDATVAHNDIEMEEPINLTILVEGDAVDLRTGTVRLEAEPVVPTKSGAVPSMHDSATAPPDPVIGADQLPLKHKHSAILLAISQLHAETSEYMSGSDKETGVVTESVRTTETTGVIIVLGAPDERILQGAQEDDSANATHSLIPADSTSNHESEEPTAADFLQETQFSELQSNVDNTAEPASVRDAADTDEIQSLLMSSEMQPVEEHPAEQLTGGRPAEKRPGEGQAAENPAAKDQEEGQPEEEAPSIQDGIDLVAAVAKDAIESDLPQDIYERAVAFISGNSEVEEVAGSTGDEVGAVMTDDTVAYKNESLEIVEAEDPDKGDQPENHSVHQHENASEDIV